MKKLIEELEDFCRYGYILNEETAKDYLEFLVDSICELLKKHVTITKSVSHELNTIRLEKELDRDEKNTYDYFERRKNKQGTLAEFESEFSKMLTQLKLEKDVEGIRKIPQRWIMWIQSTLNDYVSRFDKRSSEINTDFRDKVNWVDKNKSKSSYLPANSPESTQS